MRLVKVESPVDKGNEVAEIAFAAGITKVSFQRAEILDVNKNSEIKVIINLETSTPKAKRFVNALVAADFYNQKDFSINTRQPRSIISAESLFELTEPFVVPTTEILEELWQFSHLTAGFIGRNLIAGCFLAFGLINQQFLIIVAGLLFLPLLPLLLAIGFGLWLKQYKLAGQGLLAFTVTIVLLILSGILIALISSPPLKYNEFNSLPVSIVISAAVGVAAGLASLDDVGRRELIGLAATAQVAVIPVWFGICLIFGLPAGSNQGDLLTRAATFFLNVLTVIVASLLTYLASGAMTNKRLSENENSQ